MTREQPVRPLAPMITTDDLVEPSLQLDDDGWWDTFLVGGLVVALSILVLLLTG